VKEDLGELLLCVGHDLRTRPLKVRLALVKQSFPPG
jgi:hypothetical protein